MSSLLQPKHHKADHLKEVGVHQKVNLKLNQLDLCRLEEDLKEDLIHINLRVINNQQQEEEHITQKRV
jgi:hypothetical protein